MKKGESLKSQTNSPQKHEYYHLFSLVGFVKRYTHRNPKKKEREARRKKILSRVSQIYSRTWAESSRD